MATYAPPASRPAPYANTRMVPPAGPPGTLAPGTKIQVGSHRVVIEKYLSEGGFAHVYVVRVPMPDGTQEQAVLKRVAVPDKEQLATMRTEVETMKKLKGHKHIVTYIDSHASQLKGGGYEVFLLMEWCSGGGLIDFMNTRLQNRLTEPEILKIISDASEGVACMHYLKPPLLHRDLKVENILISSAPTSSKKLYKLCDFGSTAPPRPAATNAAEGRLIEEDVQRHTTLQYRSPEMIDVYRKKPIDEKSDIWALGVLLYKLCYYTTPFEEQGQMAILTARFKYPAYPVFSDRLKLLIATMLAEDSKKRPNIYEVICRLCAMRGVEVPIKDIYAERTQSEARRNEQLPPREPNVMSPPIVGASKASLPDLKPRIPEITPMRRGRLQGTSQQPQSAVSILSNGKRVGGDPFAALDSSSPSIRSAAVEELAYKFPALDEFSILQEKGTGFKFDATKSVNEIAVPVNSRTTQALADEAFASLQTPRSSGPSKPKPVVPVKPRTSDSPHLRAESPSIKEPTPQRPGMVSTGTMTSLPGSPVLRDLPKVSDREIWRVPSAPSSASAPTKPPKPQNKVMRTPSYKNARPEEAQQLDRDIPETTISSRPSLETLRPSVAHLGEPLHRSQSAGARTRSSKDRVPLRSKLQHIRKISETELSEQNEQVERPKSSVQAEESAIEETNITSDLDYLRVMEEERAGKSQTTEHKHTKHSSMPASMMLGSKNVFSGKLGDAFHHFENGASSRRSPSPGVIPIKDDERLNEGMSDKDESLEETEELSPELRRELERQRQSQEERRVAEAAAAYRQRVADRGEASSGAPRGPAKSSRASAIQDRVKNLLEESTKVAPVKKTASGYGRYTATPEDAAAPPQSEPIRRQAPPVAQKKLPAPPSRTEDLDSLPSTSEPQSLQASDIPIRATTPRAPPKPVGLRKPGVATVSAPPPVEDVPSDDMPEDIESDFSKRYPSLSLDIVEKEISKAQRKPARPVPLRVRDA